MRLFSKQTRDAFFFAGGLLLLLIAVGYTVYAVRFLIRTIDASFAGPSETTLPQTRFETERLEPLFESGKLKRVDIPPPSP